MLPLKHCQCGVQPKSIILSNFQSGFFSVEIVNLIKTKNNIIYPNLMLQNKNLTHLKIWQSQLINLHNGKQLHYMRWLDFCFNVAFKLEWHCIMAQEGGLLPFGKLVVSEKKHKLRGKSTLCVLPHHVTHKLLSTMLNPKHSLAQLQVSKNEPNKQPLVASPDILAYNQSINVQFGVLLWMFLIIFSLEWVHKWFGLHSGCNGTIMDHNFNVCLVTG